MRPLIVLLILFVLLLFTAPVASADHIVRLVDFDTDALGNALSDNDPVNTAYLPWGILFQAALDGPNCGPNVYARELVHPGGFGSGPNVVSTCGVPTATDISEESYRSIQATFGPPATRVCIDVWPIDSAHLGIVRGYDGGGAEIGSAESAPGAIETICLEGVGSIHSVRINGKENFYAIFDDLEVTFEDGTVDAPHPAAPGHGLQLTAAYPNPARGVLRLAIDSASELPVRVDVIDLRGRIVDSHAFAGLGAGSRLLEVPAGGTLAPGVYFARVTQGGEAARKSFVVLR